MRRVFLVCLTMVATLSTVTTGLGSPTTGERIQLPDGFQPEGVSIRPNGTFYVGSLLTGAVLAGDVRTGETELLVEPTEGRSAVGLKARRGRLFVAGGETGQAHVYDANTGAELATYRFTEAGFVNDVIVTRDAAYFTDSINPVLYQVPLTPGGAPDVDEGFDVLPYSGDIRYRDGFNVNGIEATPSGNKLIVVQSNTGLLFLVDPHTGQTRQIRLGGERVRNGDGLLLDGRCLYVVRNFNNEIALVSLAPGLARGEITKRIGDDDFDVPTTVDDFGGRLFVANARFDQPPTPRTRYWIAVVRKPAC
jgi:sugar lactone lactonase YvrE